MLLEVVYEGLESAGYTIQQLQRSSTAVYVGQINTDYYDILASDLDEAPDHTAIGTARSITSNRVSYFFDWTGPSVTIDTACSSSLVAVQQAMKTLRDGDSSMAVAAGVNLLLGPEQFVFESKVRTSPSVAHRQMKTQDWWTQLTSSGSGLKLGMLSPRGRCSMWSATADGYARGEGIAVVVLKTLSRAVADGDSIECVIREVKVNQDGQTMGITMPSAASQTSLIRATYKSCGLDPSSKDDRCQFFEAHGTGTPAGDPVEARAVQSAFFPNEDSDDQGELLVGSVKTLIGHTEGTAGLAGLLKASLAVQHGIIPANLHLDSLSPAVRPYCKHLTVPTSSLRWPELPENTPRRVSVNSFGFGGTNSHAIIESWRNSGADGPAKLKTAKPAIPCGPAVVSASSATSLMATVSALLKFVQESDDGQLADILWTLQTRRSEHRFKAAFPALDREMLIQRLRDWIKMRDHNPTITPVPVVAPSSPGDTPQIFAVFTGQGAQWPAMGMKLLSTSQSFRETFKSLEDALAKLPDPPLWSLQAQLSLQAGVTRIHAADIGQPLCTAVQIALVDLLNAAGVKIGKIVGHSSGEIAAAYAADYLTSSDAIRISYYRGLCATPSTSVTTPGGMLAAELSLNDAEALCQESRFRGRLNVAASNSPTSVTLSGDLDAVEDAMNVLNDERSVFVRRLKVDTAYHSHHMEGCASQYREFLKRCGIKVQKPGSGVTSKWYSSVAPGRDIVPETLADTYWVDNLVKPVLFSQALEAAFSAESRHQRKEVVVGLEVGPHPALKKPVLDTLSKLGIDVRYSGTLRRGANDMEAFTESLGFTWEQFLPATQVLDFDGFRRACIGTMSHEQEVKSPKLCKDLPPYCWDHSTSLWRESRMSRAMRQRGPPHPLLGHRIDLHLPVDAHGFQWRNIMRLEDVDWLRGHQFQGQTLFPAAGYVSMALDACIALTGSQHPWLIDLEDCVFHNPLILEYDSPRVLISALRILESSEDHLRAEFSCSSLETNKELALGEETTLLNFTCKARVELRSSGLKTAGALPLRASHQRSFSPVDMAELYSSVAVAGLQYTGEFMAEAVENGTEGISIVHFNRSRIPHIHLHPAILDKASHGILCHFPVQSDDDSLAIFLPRRIERLRVDVGHLLGIEAAQTTPSEGETHTDAMVADCYLRELGAQISCDVEIFTVIDYHPEVQIEGLVLSRFGAAGNQVHDRILFSQTVWRRDLAYGIDDSNCQDIGDLEETQDIRTSELANRAAYFYLKKFKDDLFSLTGGDFSASSDPQFHHWAQWATSDELHLMENAGSGAFNFEEWHNDTHEAILDWQSSHADSADLKAIVTIGEALPALLHGHTTVGQLLERNVISWTNPETEFDLSRASSLLSAAISQAVHRYPHMNIIEIGTGAGFWTTKILENLNTSSSTSHTVTGDSEETLDEARRHFGPNHNTIFRKLDIERDCLSQGFSAGEYDMMVLVVDAFCPLPTSVDAALRNCRPLLRSGGYALVISGQYRQNLCARFISMFTQQKSGKSSPEYVDTVPTTEVQWHRALLKAGFSGVDSIARDFEANDDHHNYSIMVSQAVDERVFVLREPLSHSPLVTALGPKLPCVAIVGARSLPVSKAADSLRDVLHPFAPDVTVFDSFDDVPVTFEKETCVICLSELHEPIMRKMTAPRFQRLQNILCQATHILWLTSGRRDADPCANMVLGIARSVMMESPDRPMLFIDTEKLNPDSRWLATAFLRMVLLSHSSFKNPDLLWSNETEIVIDNTGYELYPRIIPTSALNSRLNAQHSSKTELVSPGNVPLCLGPTNKDMPIVISQQAELLPQEVSFNTSSGLNLITSYSTVYPFTTDDEDACFFLSTGVDHSSGRNVLFLSPERSSHATVPPENIWSIGPGADQKLPALLQDLQQHLVIESLAINKNSRMWIHGADAAFMERMTVEAKQANANVFYSTSETATVAPGSKFIHPHCTRRSLQDIARQGFGTYVNLCGGTSGYAPLGTLIRKVLGNATKIYEVPKLDDQDQYVIPLRCNSSCLRQIIGRYVSQLVTKRDVGSGIDAQVYPIAAVSGALKPLRLFDVLDWSNPKPVPVVLKRLEPSILFSKNKTYVLAGLAGDLGLSLCGWMVANGARYVVLGSRNPDVPQETIAQLEGEEATIKVLQLDLAKQTSVQAASVAIKESSMPQVGGVVNGAMVMREKVFEDMSIEEFNDVLSPKVQGTVNLDQVFGNDLDFFVLLSSTSSVLGVPGLANYGAANTFMHTFTQQRRKRGLASSVLDISILTEHGYVARSAAKHDAAEMSRRYNVLSLSDADFYNMFAEAIYAGCRSLENDAQITSGIGSWRISSGDGESERQEMMPLWYNQPRLSYFMRFDEHHDTSSATTTFPPSGGVVKPAQFDILKELASSADFHGALITLTAHVLKKLEHLLQTPTGTVSCQLPLIKLGADSLVASQLRSWMTSELGVKLPALKILSSPSVTALCEEALTHMTDLPCVENLLGTSSSEKSSTATSEDTVPSHSLVGSQVTPSSASSSTPSDSHVDCSQDLSIINAIHHSDSHGEEPKSSDENGYGDGTERTARVSFVRDGHLSHGQSRLYLTHRYLEDKTTNNCGISGKVHGPLSMERLRKSVEKVTEKHESLRSCFLMDDREGEGRQAVLESANLVLEHKQLTHDARNTRDKLLKDFIGREFEIERGQCLRILVISSSATEHDILIVYHHLIMDGISLVVVLGELEAAYSGKALGTVPIQAIELSEMHRDACTQDTLQREMRHWSKVYPEPPQVLPLFPFARRKYRTPLHAYHSHSFEVKLDAPFAQRLRSTSSQIGATTFHFYTAALGLCLLQWLGTSDISIGIVDANRQGSVGDADSIDDLYSVGYFLNLVGVRLQIDRDAPFCDLVAQTRDKTFAALENSTTPFQTVLEKLHIPHNASHHPLFQVAINHRAGHPSPQSKLGQDCVVEWDEAIVARNPFDMHLDVTEFREDGVWISLFLQSCLYEESDAEMLMRSFVQALEHLSVAKNTNTLVRDCPVARDEDKQRAIQLGRGPFMSLDPWPATLPHRVDEMAVLYPERPAIRDAGSDLASPRQNLTYLETMRRSMQIAGCLQQRGVTPGSFVGVLQPPTADSICSMLGIMRIGAVYVPLDTLHPTERLGLMVADSKPRAILSCGSLMDKATRLCGQAHEDCVAIDLDDLQRPSATDIASVQQSARADQPACTFFTSGSTGQPKGIVLTHRNLITQIRVIGKMMGIGQEVVLQQSSLGFDPSLEQIFGGLAHGGTVVVVPETSRRDPLAIAEIMAKEGVTYTVAVPSEYASLLRYGGPFLARCQATWWLAVSGGERLGPPLLAEFSRMNLPRLQLVNAYGPTEGTISCTRGFIDYRSTTEDANAGCALPNYCVMIVDPQTSTPMAPGFPGEILIGGEGVATGYLNRIHETNTKFPSSSAFAESLGLPNTNFYRTGDSGRIMEDGMLRYLGRIEGDTQVKLRGVRIELGEVAGVISRSGGSAISDVALSLRGGGVLVAFIVFSEHFQEDKDRFLDQLLGSLPLPTSMRPVHMVPVERLPMTQNGKRDQSAIDSLPIQYPSVQGGRDPKNGIGHSGGLEVLSNALTPVEQAVKSAWEEVLPEDGDIIKGRNTDFFAVGGSSLLLLRLQSVLATTFGVRLLLPKLFQSSRLGEMTESINAELEKGHGSNAYSATMDWHSEISALADQLRPISTRRLPDKTNEFRNFYSSDVKALKGLSVLLTGSTGFVGTSILQLLIDDERVCEVHCVAIRPDRQGRPRTITRVRGSASVRSKIIEYPGDLSDRYFGLSQDDFNKLTSTVDVIIHNGADVSLLKTYASLRRPNVLSSRSLLEMALGASQVTRKGSSGTKRVPIHFVSTASVACFAQRSRPQAQDDGIDELLASALRPVSVSSSPPTPEDAVVQGYRSTKWASEALFERAVAENPAAGLHVVVHRPTSILGPGASDTDALGCIVRVSTRLMAAPRLDSTVDGVLDLVDVEDVARGIVDHALTSVAVPGVDESGRGTGITANQTDASLSTIRFVHHCNPQKMHMAHLGRYLSEKLGTSIEECDMAEWLERARGEKMSSLMQSFLREWETRDTNKIIFPVVTS